MSIHSKVHGYPPTYRNKMRLKTIKLVFSNFESKSNPPIPNVIANTARNSSVSYDSASASSSSDTFIQCHEIPKTLKG